MTRYMLIALLTMCLAAWAPAADKPVGDKPAEAPAEEAQKVLEPAHMKALEAAIGAKPGEVRGKVHTILLPRNDLDVRTLEMGEVPVEAGLETRLRLFRCGCGKYYVIGEFCVLEYESNDVIDALRAGQYTVTSVGPMLVQERPRILIVRFQGEGKIEDVVKTMKAAVAWIGENRTSRNPVKDE